MLEAVEVNREAIKTLCKAVGIREGARRMGLSEERVMKWSQRDPGGPWIKMPDDIACPQNVRTPSQALDSALADDSRATRAALGRAVRKGAEHLEEQPGELIVEKAKAVQQLTSAAGMIGGWGERGQDQGGDMLILSIGGNVNLGQQVVQND